jgi:hypothetical protein
MWWTRALSGPIVPTLWPPHVAYLHGYAANPRKVFDLIRTS